MRSAWLAMAALPNLRAFDFLSTCVHARDDYLAANVRSPREHRVHYGRLQKMARELASAIERDWELQGVARVGLMQATRLAQIQKEFLATLKRSSCMAQGASPRRWGPEDLALMLAADACSMMPSTADVLRECADAAGKLAELGPLSTRPKNRDTAALNYFVRRLSMFFQRQHGRRMLSVVAASASVLFDVTVDASRARKAIGRFSKNTA